MNEAKLAPKAKKKPALKARTYWEPATRAGGKRLVREWLDSLGRVARWEVAAVLP